MIKEKISGTAAFQFTEDGLTEFVNEAIRLHQTSPKAYWYAACSSLAHTDAKAWTGSKRSDRKEAIKDSVAHNKQYNHQAGVLGPFN